MTYKPPVMDEDLRTHRLLAILDVLIDADTPLTVPQIQRRLSEKRYLDLSRAEIEAHLSWGSNQPNATNAPVRPTREFSPPIRRHGRVIDHKLWVAVPKHPLTPEEREAAGPPPWEE